MNSINNINKNYEMDICTNTLLYIQLTRVCLNKTYLKSAI